MSAHNNHDPSDGSGPSLLRISIIMLFLALAGLGTLGLMVAA